MRPVQIVFIAIALAVLASCLPTSTCACSPIIPSLAVYGVVDGPDGAPVVGATVDVEYLIDRCPPGGGVIQAASVTTGNAGGWEAEVWEENSEGCVRVRAAGPAGSGLGTTEAVLPDSQGDPLPFGTDPDNRLEVPLELPAADSPG